jgi:hypothetical protein
LSDWANQFGLCWLDGSDSERFSFYCQGLQVQTLKLFVAGLQVQTLKLFIAGFASTNPETFLSQGLQVQTLTLGRENEHFSKRTESAGLVPL